MAAAEARRKLDNLQLENADSPYCRPKALPNTQCIDSGEQDSKHTSSNSASDQKRIINPPETLTQQGDIILRILNDSVQTDYIVASVVLSLGAPKLLPIEFDKNFLPVEKFDGATLGVVTIREHFQHNNLRLLLRVLHYETEDVPKDLDTARLVSIAQFCDKLDCARIFAPWSERWVTGVDSRSPIELSGATPTLPELLLIGRVFRRQDIVADATRKLIQSISSPSVCGLYVLQYHDKPLLGSTSTCIMLDQIPTSYKDRILEARKEGISTLSLTLKDFVRKLEAEDGEFSKKCGNANCFDLSYGSFMRSIRQNGLWKLTFDDDIEWRASLNCLLKTISNLRMKSQKHAVSTSKTQGPIKPIGGHTKNADSSPETSSLTLNSKSLFGHSFDAPQDQAPNNTFGISTTSVRLLRSAGLSVRGEKLPFGGSLSGSPEQSFGSLGTSKTASKLDQPEFKPYKEKDQASSMMNHFQSLGFHVKETKTSFEEARLQYYKETNGDSYSRPSKRIESPPRVGLCPLTKEITNMVEICKKWVDGIEGCEVV